MENYKNDFYRDNLYIFYPYYRGGMVTFGNGHRYKLGHKNTTNLGPKLCTQSVDRKPVFITTAKDYALMMNDKGQGVYSRLHSKCGFRKLRVERDKS